MKTFLLFLLLASPTLAEVYEVSGRVTGPDGEPVIWANLHFRIGDNPPFLAGSTREDGTFSVRVEEGTYMMNIFQDHGYAHAFVEPIVVQGGPVHGVELRMERTIALEGRFVLPPESQMPRMAVAIQTPVMEPIEPRPDGSFRVQLGPGEWVIRAHLPVRRDNMSLWATGQVRLERGQPAPPFEMELPAGEESLEGRFVETYSNQWGIRLRRDLPDGVSLHAEVGTRDGRFRLEGLPAGFYTLQVYQIECDPGDQQVLYEQPVLVPSKSPVLLKMAGGPRRAQATAAEDLPRP